MMFLLEGVGMRRPSGEGRVTIGHHNRAKAKVTSFLLLATRLALLIYLKLLKI